MKPHLTPYDRKSLPSAESSIHYFISGVKTASQICITHSGGDQFNLINTMMRIANNRHDEINFGHFYEVFTSLSNIIGFKDFLLLGYKFFSDHNGYPENKQQYFMRLIWSWMGMRQREKDPTFTRDYAIFAQFVGFDNTLSPDEALHNNEAYYSNPYQQTHDEAVAA